MPTVTRVRALLPLLLCAGDELRLWRLACSVFALSLQSALPAMSPGQRRTTLVLFGLPNADYEDEDEEEEEEEDDE